jgi:undecaprenyl-diphosphatase
MTAVSTLGNPLLLIAVVVFLAGFLFLRRRLRAGSFVAVAFAGGFLLLLAIRGLVGRERPEVHVNPLEESAATPSFPSERALLAAVAYLPAALALGAGMRSPRRQFLLAAASLLVLLIGVSRLYAGVCYPSDVLAGWLAGLTWVLFVQYLTPPASAAT